MIYHFTVLFFSVLFFISLFIISERSIVPAWSFFLITAGSLITLSIIAAKKLTGYWYTAYLPSTLAFSVPLLLSLIDRGFETRAFIIIASLIYYVALLGIYRLRQNERDKTARAMLNLTALSSLFFVFTATYGLYINYEVHLAILLTVFFVVSFVVALHTLFTAWEPKDTKLILLTAFAIGMLMTELVWVIHFWPFGYLTVGTALLIHFYLLWKISFDLIRGQFVFKNALQESAILIALLVLLVMTSPWNLVG